MNPVKNYTMLLLFRESEYLQSRFNYRLKNHSGESEVGVAGDGVRLDGWVVESWEGSGLTQILETVTA